MRGIRTLLFSRPRPPLPRHLIIQLTLLFSVFLLPVASLTSHPSSSLSLRVPSSLLPLLT